MRNMNMQIPKELKGDIETNQNQLKTAIRNHQTLVQKFKDDSGNVGLQRQIETAEQQIVFIGLLQKGIIERLRQELKRSEKDAKSTAIKNGIEEKRLNFVNVLHRNRKQNVITRSTSVTSSDDSADPPSHISSPEPATNPLVPQDVSQCEFLQYFNLATHSVYKEMQNRRVERKRRSTANPQFLYGNRGWDFTAKRQKRGNYLISQISPPNTRQSAKNKKLERVSPPPSNGKKCVGSFPAIPNLPSGLTIERVSPSRSSPDSKACISCRQGGSLSVCEVCYNGFHIECHNRPLTQSPRQCPRCLSSKEVRTVGALTVPSGMSVSYVSAGDVSEKREEKKALQEKHQALTAELSQLKERHSQLTVSLKNQRIQREELLTTQQTTEEKIKTVVSFVATIKSTVEAPS